MGAGIVAELFDQRMPLEGSLDDASLNAPAAPVHDPHFPDPRLNGRIHVLLDDRRHVAGCKGMKIELTLNRNVDRIHAIYRWEFTTNNAGAAVWHYGFRHSQL
jgi:hypothetical protein